ncbi:hypothetical protein [Tumidithrix helvetica]|uniref:hypothetical protein n=1 Tax=Tumidithrix helvetica TaxID=3457545 RepID=UPI003CC66F97
MLKTLVSRAIESRSLLHDRNPNCVELICSAGILPARARSLYYVHKQLRIVIVLQRSLGLLLGQQRRSLNECMILKNSI